MFWDIIQLCGGKFCVAHAEHVHTFLLPTVPHWWVLLFVSGDSANCALWHHGCEMTNGFFGIIFKHRPVLRENDCPHRTAIFRC